MKKIFYIAFAIMSFPVCAQFVVKGSIVDKENSEKLSSANIYIYELNKSTVSESDGSYRFSNIPKGVYSIQASILGYQSLVKTVEVNDSTVVDFEMGRSYIEMNEVIVAGQPASMQDQNSNSVNVVTANDLRQIGATTVMDGIATVSGVTQLTTGHFISRPVIRGLSGNRVLVVNQGMRLENQQWDDEHGIGVTDIGIDRVEVIKGPASLLFGPEAMGGVINFIEEQPAPTGHIVGDLGGSFHSNGLGFIANGGLKGATEKYFWRVRGGGRNFSDYYDGDFARVANSRFGEGNAKATIGARGSWGNTSLNYDYQYSFFDIVEAGEEPSLEEEEFPREAEPPYHDIIHQTVSSQSTFLLGASRLKTVFGFQNDMRGEYEPNGTKEGYPYLDMTLNSYTYDVRWQAPTWKNITATLGTQGMYQTNKNGATHRLIPDADLNDLGFAVVTKYAGSKLNIDLGLRYDSRQINTEVYGKKDSLEYMPALQKTFSAMNGALGGTYKVGEVVLARANFASGYKAPNMSELLSNGIKLETGHFEKGNINFTNEQNLQIDLGLDIKTKNFTIQLSAYQNNIRNYIYLFPTDSIVNYHFLYQYKQNDAVIQGAEVGLAIHPTALSWIRLESKMALVSAKLSDGSYLPFIPATRFTNSIITEFKRWKKLQLPYFRFTAVTVMPQDQTAKYEYKTNGYTLLNASLGTTVTLYKLNVEFYLAGNNLLNIWYMDHLSRIRPFGVANMGLNVSLGLRIPFTLK